MKPKNRKPGRPKTRTTNAPIIGINPPSDEFVEAFQNARKKGETKTEAAVRLIMKGIEHS